MGHRWQSGGTGWVLHNDCGKLLRAGGTGLPYCGTALAAEAEAIRESLGACLQLGFKKIEVESNSKEII